jgi:protein-S-isoprenylcysteine O-methyltransferase Ste14
MTSGISDQSSPDSTRLGEWLFRRRTVIPVPFAVALLLLPASAGRFSRILVVVGVAMTAAGELVRLFSVHHIGVISRTRSDRLGPLITTGPFRIVRNPLYVGNILVWSGFALTARVPWAAPVIAALLLAEYHQIVRWEEWRLEERYEGVYRNYIAHVPRWLPHWPSAVDDRPGDAAFSWRESFFSERGTLLAIAAGYLLLWLKA